MDITDCERHTHLFRHDREIPHGEARILYVQPYGHPGGWAIPGGTITSDWGEAKAAAVLVDRLIKAGTQAQEIVKRARA